MGVPPDDNTISYASIAQPCMDIRGKGNRGPGPCQGRCIPDIILPPHPPPPVIGGPPKEIIIKPPDRGTILVDCRCFMHSPSEDRQVNSPFHGPGCFSREF